MTPTRRTIAKCDTFQGGRQRSAATMQGDLLCLPGLGGTPRAVTVE
jgi:hypothetical protein